MTFRSSFTRAFCAPVLLSGIATPAAAVITDVDAQYRMRVTGTQEIWGRTRDAQGRALPNQPVRVSATCGTFANGQTSLALTSDGIGYLSTGLWTAPSTPGTCSITLTEDVAPFSSVTATMKFIALGADRFSQIGAAIQPVQFGTTASLG